MTSSPYNEIKAAEVMKMAAALTVVKAWTA
jgi:hypothetical protein